MLEPLQSVGAATETSIRLSSTVLEHPLNLSKIPFLVEIFVGVFLGYSLLGRRIVKQGASFAARLFDSPLTIAAIVLFGGLLRFYGTDFGLPRPYHPDEHQKAIFLSKMIARNSLDPQFALQPPFLLYLTGFVSALIKPFQLVDGNSIARHLLAGRMVNAFCGTVSIYLVYCIGRRTASNFVAVAGALFFAIVPLHVTNSRYMKEDVLFLTFVIACLLAVLKFIDLKKLRYLYLAGLMAGLAFGAKYTGLVTVGIVIVTPWLIKERFSFRPDYRVLRHAFFASLLMPVGFVLANPYMLESFNNFAQVYYGFRAESRHAMRGHIGYAVDPWSQLWMFHFSNSLIPGMSFPLIALALLGVGVALREWRSKLLILVGLAVLFYLPAEWARSKPPPQPDRYVIACVPFLALLAAYALEKILARLDTKPLGQGIALAALVVLPLERTLEITSEIRNDTRKQTTAWMRAELPRDTRLLLAGGTLYLPQIPQNMFGKPLRKFLTQRGDKAISEMRGSSFRYLITTDFEQIRFKTKNDDDVKSDLLKMVEANFPIARQFRSRFGSYGFHNPIITVFDLKGPPPILPQVVATPGVEQQRPDLPSNQPEATDPGVQTP